MSFPVAGIVRVLNEVAASQAPLQTSSSAVNSAYAYLVTLNPIILIILGVIVIFAGRLAKWIGIIMVIIGVILLALPFLLGLHL